MRPQKLPAIWRRCVSGAVAVGVAVSLVGPAAAESKSRQIAVRLMAQEGLSVALAANVLYTQQTALFAVLAPSQGCVPFGAPEEGSYRVESHSPSDTKPGRTKLTVAFFFDAACRKPFARADMKADMTVADGEYAFDLTGKVAYRDANGRLVGSLSVAETALIRNGKTQLSGLGTYKPRNGTPKARFGLACKLGGQLFTSAFSCAGGVAQAFPDLRLSLGSVTPLDFQPRAGELRFSSDGSTLASAPEGDLDIKEVKKLSLALSAPHTARGSTTVEGATPAIALFLKTPTRWRIANPKTGDVLVYEGLSGAKGGARVIVKDKADRRVAVIKLDRSGTGTARFFDGEAVPVSTWVLGG